MIWGIVLLVAKKLRAALRVVGILLLNIFVLILTLVTIPLVVLLDFLTKRQVRRIVVDENNMDNTESLSENLRKSIQSYAHDDETLEGFYLAGYMVTAEWIGPDGEKYISTIRSENSTSWQCLGYAMETISQSIANDVATRLFDTAEADEDEE